VVLGHQVEGRAKAIGCKVDTVKTGDRLGVAWILSAGGTCKFCLSGREDLCAAIKATGRDRL
jgi:propanol-preferring alcohol dehydrogenase